MKLKKLLAVAALVISPVTMADNILVVMSDISEMKLKNGYNYKTGFYLNELMEPVKLFMDAGHTLTFATPTGLAPTLDPVSDTPEHFLDVSKANYNVHKTLLNKLKLTDKKYSPILSFSRIEQIGIEHFDAVFVPGGHAPLGDLVANDQLGSFLRHFNAESKPTALVCHGPVALLSALANNADFEVQMKAGKKAKPAAGWIYDGYNMTTFSNAEETVATKYYLGGDELFYWPQAALTNAGGNYSRSQEDWQPHIVVDRELITGQNNKSSVGVAQALLTLLN
ncbi:type 1 glutamine amidotransferase domain-containing protein [Thalassomonas actiniarum]|uniref:Type 1 glutamine amidotransferase domain-containing protein n=1 Tax=Thalassomonas actiniarum TaxID=485447 RepID=A0AAF0C4R1_9GAMM|nr:type 1 glutamine amidotransferase domain-containing protein [Thalassomonas actiniarum]WDE02562.1 type 1 glutamine amidotransferase domain-containing protein [Thalassomonas actiniarum]